MTEAPQNQQAPTISEDNKEAYTRAITAYQFHIERYNTWMNYYSIFVGALFIAYYSIKPDSTLDSNIKFIHPIITVVGLISSICWLASLKGYYSWLISWTHVVQFHEKRIIGNDDTLRVYTLISKDILKQNGFSTQKVTQVFITIIIGAWLSLIGFQLYKITSNQCTSICFPIIIALILICLFNSKDLKKCLFSNIEPEFKDISEVENQ